MCLKCLKIITFRIDLFNKLFDNGRGLSQKHLQRTFLCWVGKCIITQCNSIIYFYVWWDYVVKISMHATFLMWILGSWFFSFLKMLPQLLGSYLFGPQGALSIFHAITRKKKKKEEIHDIHNLFIHLPQQLKIDTAPGHHITSPEKRLLQVLW